jgi:anti-anti-sigma factor
MTDSNIATITTEKNFTLVTFNVASLTAGSGLEYLAEKIPQIVRNDKPQNLIVDFKGIKFFSSQTLGILLDARKKIAAYNGNVVICSINPQLYRVFKITNLDKIFKFYPDAPTAIADLKKTT